MSLSAHIHHSNPTKIWNIFITPTLDLNIQSQALFSFFFTIDLFSLFQKFIKWNQAVYTLW